MPALLRPFVLSAVLALAIVPASVAQSLWSTPYVPNQVALEVLQPGLSGGPDEDVDLLTGAATLWGSRLLNDRTTLVAGVPMARYAADTPAGAVSEQLIGNPYVGLGVSSTRVPLLVELGARLPLAPPQPAAARAGAVADLAHREAFAPDLLSAQLILNARWDWTRSAGLRLRGGPLGTLSTPDDARTTELYLRYGVQGWYEGERLIVGLGITGRALATERGGAFSDRTIHQATGTLIVNGPRVQPGVLFRTPINGPDSDATDLVVGLTLSVTL